MYAAGFHARVASLWASSDAKSMSTFKTVFCLWSFVPRRPSGPPSPPRGHLWRHDPSDGAHTVSPGSFPWCAASPAAHCAGLTLPATPLFSPDFSTQGSCGLRPRVAGQTVYPAFVVQGGAGKDSCFKVAKGRRPRKGKTRRPSVCELPLFVLSNLP